MYVNRPASALLFFSFVIIYVLYHTTTSFRSSGFKIFIFFGKRLNEDFSKNMDFFNPPPNFRNSLMACQKVVPSPHSKAKTERSMMVMEKKQQIKSIWRGWGGWGWSVVPHWFLFLLLFLLPPSPYRSGDNGMHRPGPGGRRRGGVGG